MDAVDGIRRGYEEVKAGRRQPVAEVLEALLVKHGLSRFRFRAEAAADLI